MNYRKIWEESNDAKIPPGYHIHHIDGDHHNNHPDNLICVSPEEHWQIHEKQGDIRCLSGRFVQGAAEAGRIGGSAGKGKKYSEEMKIKFSNAQKAGYEKRGGSSLKGRKLSEEHKKNIGDGVSGEKNGMYGKRHSDETKEKISLHKSGIASREAGWNHTEETINIIREKRKEFFENGGRSPFSNLYTLVSSTGETLCTKMHRCDIIEFLNISEREFRTLSGFCKRSPNRCHPKFNVLLINEGKMYA